MYECVMYEYRNEPDWIGIDAERLRSKTQKTIVVQMPKETKQPVGFAPPAVSPQIEIPHGYRQREKA